MTPLQALNDVCREFCGPTNAARGTHDDACTMLREVVNEWAMGQIRGASEDGCRHCQTADPDGTLCVDGALYGACGHDACEGSCAYLSDCRCPCHERGLPVAVISEAIAAERERIAQKIEWRACDGSPDSCDDVKAGSVCPYDHAAAIARGEF